MLVLLQGTDDVIVLPENAKRLAAEFPSSCDTRRDPSCRDTRSLPEQPEAIAKAVLAYLQR